MIMNVEQAVKEVIKHTKFAKFMPYYTLAKAGIVIAKATIVGTAFAAGYVSQTIRDKQKYDSMYNLKGNKQKED